VKNIILQHFDGELRELDKLSKRNIEEYAKMVGADYRLILGKPFLANVTDAPKNLTSPFGKCHMLDSEFDEYDQVLMLDIDMFAPKGMTENVFELEGVGLYADTQVMLHNKIARQYPDIASLKAPYWGGAIYKMDKNLRRDLRFHLMGDKSWMNKYNEAYHFEDEGIMHTLALRAGLKHAKKWYLDRKWCQCSFLPNPEKAGFIHIRTKITPSGPKQEKIKNYQALVNKGIL
jgi:hypothetical protein